METLSLSEVVEQLADMPPSDAALRLDLVAPERAAEVLPEMDEGKASGILSRMRAEAAAAAVAHMRPSSAARLLERVEPQGRSSLLERLQPGLAEAIFEEVSGDWPRKVGRWGVAEPAIARILGAMSPENAVRYMTEEQNYRKGALWLQADPGVARLLPLMPISGAARWLDAVDGATLVAVLEHLPDEYLSAVLAATAIDSMDRVWQALGEDRLARVLIGMAPSDRSARMARIRHRFGTAALRRIRDAERA
ncbi:magnesium transporter MgtE N-terminal domain-containing protein [Nucisporomicrobium flavum]|uniref:magnesium transporter MgtE N-terminal domain-containing protein n=1 Tax=Nucisporomicrobium flavum TaxID=2785915 RepID=UPI0018F6BA77|nr:hypothetical protein [Nucisporomicrobium flavum]